MGDHASEDLTEAFATARALLTGAENEAERVRAEAQAVRADAERYARQREQEAELLVAKARRVLRVAEEKAAAIIATARVQRGRLADGEEVDPETVELVEGERLEPEAGGVRKVVAPGATTLRQGVEARAAGEPSRFDRILAQAITRAVEHAFDERAG